MGIFTRFLGNLWNLSIGICRAVTEFVRKIFSIFFDPAHPLLPLQNPASASTITEPLLLHTPALISSATTLDDGDDYRHPVCEDRVLCCQEAASNMVPVSFDENETPYLKNEEEKKRKEKEKEEEEEKDKSVIVVDEERWIKHYSSHHRILLVGEGNFSFSACLAKAFRCASNIIATSLDSEAFLKENYKKASSNIEELKSRGSKVMHGIDANHHLLGLLQFDRIVFNFPFAGFFTESTKSQLRHHRRLVSMFMKNAKEMIGEDGEIHISHKTSGDFYAQFKLENIASSHGLRLIEAVKFERSDYPGYNTKYGFGGDENFNCVPSNTYKFGLKRRRSEVK